MRIDNRLLTACCAAILFTALPIYLGTVNALLSRPPAIVRQAIASARTPFERSLLAEGWRVSVEMPTPVVPMFVLLRLLR